MSDEIVLIQNLIYEIRGQKVMLDSDLAKLYQVETKVLNQAVKRNLKRFPPHFMFQLDSKEFTDLKSQIVTSSWGVISNSILFFLQFNGRIGLRGL